MGGPKRSETSRAPVFAGPPNLEQHGRSGLWVGRPVFLEHSLHLALEVSLVVAVLADAEPLVLTLCELPGHLARNAACVAEDVVFVEA